MTGFCMEPNNSLKWVKKTGNNFNFNKIISSWAWKNKIKIK